MLQKNIIQELMVWNQPGINRLRGPKIVSLATPNYDSNLNQTISEISTLRHICTWTSDIPSNAKVRRLHKTMYPHYTHTNTHTKTIFFSSGILSMMSTLHFYIKNDNQSQFFQIFLSYTQIHNWSLKPYQSHKELIALVKEQHS